MVWTLLTREKIQKINEKVMDEAGAHSVVLKPDALSAAAEGAGFDYEESLAGAAYLVAAAIVQEHPFADGNKRTAARAVKNFLKHNGRTLTEDQMTGVRKLIGRLADEDPIEKEDFITSLEHILSLGALVE